jgi:hypothetical protein
LKFQEQERPFHVQIIYCQRHLSSDFFVLSKMIFEIGPLKAVQSKVAALCEKTLENQVVFDWTVKGGPMLLCRSKTLSKIIFELAKLALDCLWWSNQK